MVSLPRPRHGRAPRVDRGGRERWCWPRPRPRSRPGPMPRRGNTRVIDLAEPLSARRRLPAIRHHGSCGAHERPGADRWLAPNRWSGRCARGWIAAGEQALLFLNRRGYRAADALPQPAAHRFGCPALRCLAGDTPLPEPADVPPVRPYGEPIPTRLSGLWARRPTSRPAALASSGMAEEAGALFPEARIEVLSSDLAAGPADMKLRGWRRSPAASCGYRHRHPDGRQGAQFPDADAGGRGRCATWGSRAAICARPSGRSSCSTRSRAARGGPTGRATALIQTANARASRSSAPWSRAMPRAFWRGLSREPRTCRGHARPMAGIAGLIW